MRKSFDQQPTANLREQLFGMITCVTDLRNGRFLLWMAIQNALTFWISWKLTVLPTFNFWLQTKTGFPDAPRRNSRFFCVFFSISNSNNIAQYVFGLWSGCEFSVVRGVEVKGYGRALSINVRVVSRVRVVSYTISIDWAFGPSSPADEIANGMTLIPVLYV